MVEKDQLLAYIYAKLTYAPHLARELTQIKETRQPFRHRNVYFKLKEYVDTFLARETPGSSENRIVVLPGLRGLGKTTLLLQLYDYLTQEKRIDQERVLYLPTDELKAYLGKDILETITVFVEDVFKTSLVNLDKQLFIFIDEVHFDKSWDVAAKIVYDQTKNVFLILTGSSALSIEMSVDLVRRSQRKSVFPLSFGEYLLLKYNIRLPFNVAENIRALILDPSKAAADSAGDLWGKVKRAMLPIGTPLEKEFEYFMSSGGFPFSIYLDEKSTYERIYSMIERVVAKDVFELQSFNTETRHLITRIIYYIASQTPGGTSDIKLANSLHTSPTLIRSILEVLEKTHLIFSIKPLGGAGKSVRKSWKYYFLSPSINAAIRSELGICASGDRKTLGLFAENLVAAYLFRLKETTHELTGLFYDPDKGGADFLILRGVEKVLPVEVGIGEKGEDQVKSSMKRYHSEYGVVLSRTGNISMDRSILHVPITFFSFA